jgi:hypothetical protein
MSEKPLKRKDPLWKVIAYDVAGITCLILVPFLGPLPGPGGIPLLLAGFGLLAVNHDWADDAILYVKKHGDNVIKIFFPNKFWIKWAWDIGLAGVFIFGLWVETWGDSFLYTILGLLFNAGATTLFMLNRGRLDWVNTQLRKFGRK